jgi:hypothetical protein
MNWIILWKGILLLTLIGYSILAIIVFFGGIKNIIAMLKDLSAPTQTPENDTN